MEPLSRSELTIKVTIEDAEEDTKKSPEAVQKGLKYLKEYLEERKYEDVHWSVVKNPRSTDRGILYAEGTFAGPSPNNGENRDPQDFSDEYRFIVVEDRDYEDLFLIEAYYHTRLLAKFEVKSDSLKLLSGEIETVE